MTKPAAVFFDWDGTLIDGFESIIGGYNAALGAFGLPLLSPAEAQTRIRRSLREVFPEIFGSDAEQAQKIYLDYVRANHLDLIKPLAHSREVLEFLVRSQIPAAIVSNKTHALLEKEINHLGWAHLLQTWVGAGVTSRDKPAPDQIFLAAEQTGVSGMGQQLWYIGDTETDMEAAHQAGAFPVFIKHGLGKNEEQFQYPPSLVFNDCESLIFAIKSLL